MKINSLGVDVKFPNGKTVLDIILEAVMGVLPEAVMNLVTELEIVVINGHVGIINHGLDPNFIPLLECDQRRINALYGFALYLENVPGAANATFELIENTNNVAITANGERNIINFPWDGGGHVAQVLRGAGVPTVVEIPEDMRENLAAAPAITFEPPTVDANETQPVTVDEELHIVLQDEDYEGFSYHGTAPPTPELGEQPENARAVTPATDGGLPEREHEDDLHPATTPTTPAIMPDMTPIALEDTPVARDHHERTATPTPIVVDGTVRAPQEIIGDIQVGTQGDGTNPIQPDTMHHTTNVLSGNSVIGEHSASEGSHGL